MVNLKKRNKRGSLQDTWIYGAAIIFFALAILIGFKVMDMVNTEFQASDSITVNGKAASTTLMSNYSGVIDNSFLFFAIGLAVVSLSLAALVRFHPIFIPLFLMGWVFLVFISGIFSNIYNEMAINPDMVALANQLTFTTNILNLLPMFVGVFGIILMIVMFKRWQVGNF